MKRNRNTKSKGDESAVIDLNDASDVEIIDERYKNTNAIINIYYGVMKIDLPGVNAVLRFTPEAWKEFHSNGERAWKTYEAIGRLSERLDRLING